uniref:CCHC-type domain-containing protein n=1 Tax=Fagus sylvatica TaxID=28930 RepID=A0A2N9J7P9_FAGSY
MTAPVAGITKSTKSLTRYLFQIRVMGLRVLLEMWNQPVHQPLLLEHRSGISYKDSLIGVIPGAYEHAFFGNSMEEDEIISSDEEEDEEPPEEGEVVIKFTRELKHRIRAPWSTSLIVKVFGRSVGLPELPMEYYHKDSLLHIGSGLGPVLRVDFNTAAGTRGRFARICVQIDLDKPLARTVRVGKTRLAVIYEGIGLLCFHCGRIGHRSELCPSHVLEEEETSTDTAVVPRDDATVIAAPDRAVGFSAVQGHDNFIQHGHGANERAAARLIRRPPVLSSPSALNSLNPKVVMTSTQWGVFPLFKASPSWRIRLGGQSIRIDEDVIELIRKDPLHVWGWYDAEIAQAWTEIAPAFQEEDPPLLNDMVWLQEISPFWNFLTNIPRIDGIHCLLRVRCQQLRELRFVQFLEEVYCATLPEFEERKVMLSTPIHFNWPGNRKSLKLAQIAKCVPLSNLWIRCSELRGKGFLEYQFTSTVIQNNMWEMWPEKAWNSLEAEGTLFPPNNPPFMSSSEIEILILTETRLGGDRAAELARSFPFDGFLCTNTIGFAGGIWILWKTEAVEVGHLCSTEQEIHASVKVRVVEKAWATPALNLSITFAIFAALVTAWNKSKFGNIFHRKKRILARLNGVQCSLTARPSESLYRIEKSLREDYFTILKLKKELWALKSRVGWVVEGDRNTKFFHTSTIVCRKANKIVRLRNSVEEWIIDNELIRLHIQQWFVDLFSTSHLHPPNGFCLPIWAPRISDQEALSLTAHVDAKDVKMSLWSLKAFKAPGPNGLHPRFFQKCWPTVGDSVVNEAAFVPGRRGLDNVVIAQELIHSIHRKKGRMGQLILKLDLEKAYDRLEWDFIPLVNGGQLDNFKPSRGIRQGDSFISLPIHNLYGVFEALRSLRHRLLVIVASQSLEFSKIVVSSPVKSTPNLGKYLGFPLRTNGHSSRDFDFVVEKVQAKLPSWKAKLLSPVGNGLRWVVNNGQEISFWHDLWVGDSPLRSLVHGPLSVWEDSLRVCDVVEGVSMWNLSTLSFDIPTCTQESIKAISVCPNRPLADKRVWDSVGGDFKLGKAYSIACNKFSECSSLKPSSWILES